MAVFSQECGQREQCAQPDDNNEAPYYLSCAALDRTDHSQQGSVTLGSLGASDCCPAWLASGFNPLTLALGIDSYRLIGLWLGCLSL